MAPGGSAVADRGGTGFEGVVRAWLPLLFPAGTDAWCPSELYPTRGGSAVRPSTFFMKSGDPCGAGQADCVRLLQRGRLDGKFRENTRIAEEKVKTWHNGVGIASPFSVWLARLVQSP